MKSNPKVSIIIPVYNGQLTLRACLNSVLSQDFCDYEIIVIDSSKDESSKIIELEFPKVRLYHFNEKKSRGEAVNIGIERSKGDYLFFIDIDCIINKDALSSALIFFEEDQELAGLCFAIQHQAKLSVIEKVDYLLEFYHWLPCQKRKRFTKYLAGCACVYKKECLTKNRFEEFNNHGEDVLLSLRLANQGRKLLFEPSLQVTHINIKNGFGDFFRHQFHVGQGSAIVHKKDNRFQLFSKFPLFIFAAPLYIVPLMGLTYLTRKDFPNVRFFLKYFTLFFIGNWFWAAGFFKQMSYSINQ